MPVEDLCYGPIGIGLAVPTVRVRAAGRIRTAGVQATSVRHPVDAQRARLAGQEDQTLLYADLAPGQFSHLRFALQWHALNVGDAEPIAGSGSEGLLGSGRVLALVRLQVASKVRLQGVAPPGQLLQAQIVPLHQSPLIGAERVAELLARDRQRHDVIRMFPPPHEQRLPWRTAGRIIGFLPDLLKVVPNGLSRTLNDYCGVGGLGYRAHGCSADGGRVGVIGVLGQMQIGDAGCAAEVNVSRSVHLDVGGLRIAPISEVDAIA